MYLVAIMGWHSRKILSWRISNTLDSTFCINALEGVNSFLENFRLPLNHYKLIEMVRNDHRTHRKFGQAEPYEIHINWSETTIIELDSAGEVTSIYNK